jgi:lipid-A-disaccharide synthase-like uncharacterized protein
MKVLGGTILLVFFVCSLLKDAVTISHYITLNFIIIINEVEDMWNEAVIA